jgi:hypothetical protein
VAIAGGAGLVATAGQVGSAGHYIFFIFDWESKNFITGLYALRRRCGFIYGRANKLFDIQAHNHTFRLAYYLILSGNQIFAGDSNNNKTKTIATDKWAVHSYGSR